MAWYNSIKDLGHDIGGITSNPWVKGGTAALLAATGVGAPAAAAIMAGQGLIGNALKPGGNVGSALGGGLQGAATGYAAGKLGNALGGGGGAAGDAAGGGGFLGTLEGLGKGALGALGGSGGIGGMLGGLGKDALGFLTGNGGMNALGAAGAVNAALLQNKANEYAKNALGTQQQSYNERAPLRTGGIQAMRSALGANPYSGTAMPARQPNAIGVQPAMRPVTLGGGY